MPIRVFLMPLLLSVICGGNPLSPFHPGRVQETAPSTGRPARNANCPPPLAGITGISVPCGFTQSGLPIGLQLIGGHFQEATILRAAYAFQEHTDFHTKQPTLKRS